MLGYLSESLGTGAVVLVAGLTGRAPGQPHAAAALLTQQRRAARRLALPVHHAPPARPAPVV